MKSTLRCVVLRNSLLAILAGAWLFLPPLVMGAQDPAAAWTPKRLPDGQPDFQGFWVAEPNGYLSLVNPSGGPPGGNPPGGLRDSGAQALPGTPGAARPRAPSRIIDPADGEIPYQPWARAKQQHLLANFTNPVEPQYIDPPARCYPGGVSRLQYWHTFEIRQYPGVVVFLHDSATRVIYLDGRPHVPENIKLWMSDSRGHWEGKTLVVDVTNSNSKHRLSQQGDFASDKVHITERFTIVDANHYTYTATYDDPSVYTRPWTLFANHRRIHIDEPEWEWWEYACIEGEQNAENAHGDD